MCENHKDTDTMVCVPPEANKTLKRLFWIVVMLFFFVLTDFIVHYNSYWELQYCSDTFKEKCQLIAVPASVKGLADAN